MQPAVVARRAFAGGDVDVADRDVRPARQCALRGRQPDPARAAGDQHRLAREPSFGHRCACLRSGKLPAMGLLWGIVKTVVLAMAAIVAILVAIDVILARNLFRPRDT